MDASCPTNSQFAGHLRGCWTQFLSEKQPATANFRAKTAARLLHTFAQNELQPSHTSGNRAGQKRRPRWPSRHRKNPPQTRLDLCFIQSLPRYSRPAARCGESRRCQNGEARINLKVGTVRRGVRGRLIAASLPDCVKAVPSNRGGFNFNAVTQRGGAAKKRKSLQHEDAENAENRRPGLTGK